MPTKKQTILRLKMPQWIGRARGAPIEVASVAFRGFLFLIMPKHIYEHT
jgi:hypothetical protein